MGVKALGTRTSIVGLIFTNKRSGEPTPLFEYRCGVLACCLLLAAGALLAVFGGTRTFFNPTGVVLLECIVGVAELAGERWKMRLSLVALLPMAALLGDRCAPGWFQHLFR